MAACAREGDQPKTEIMAIGKWRVRNIETGVFRIGVDTGLGFRPATTHEVETGLAQLALFGMGDGEATDESTQRGERRPARPPETSDPRPDPEAWEHRWDAIESDEPDPGHRST